MQTAVKERPILFSAPMVRALLEGRKTQTRRIVKGAAGAFWDHGAAVGHSPWSPTVVDSGILWEDREGACDGYLMPIRNPYGQPGDHLWVRETWDAPSFYYGLSIASTKSADRFYYRADDESASGRGFGPWRPSIHMPRWASRLTLEITSIRVERVQDITEADAIAEGMQTLPAPQWYPTWRDTFLRLFRDINDLPDDANPWVWVVEFKTP